MALVSVFHPYSYGQVVAANDDQSRTIKVKVLEHLASQYGVPNDEISKETIDVEVFNGTLPTNPGEEVGTEIRTVSVSFKDFVPANWLNRSANLISPPKVVVGQRVLLWRVGDSRQYYWEELDVDMRLKQDEHLLIAINNHNDGERLDLDNAYIIEASTRDSRIRVRTNRNNGEKAAYEVDINGGKGFLKMMDDCAGSKEDYQGNGILINSVDTIVKMQNIDDTHYILDKEDILINCKGNRTATIGGTDSVTAKDVEYTSETFTTTATDITTKAVTIKTTATTIESTATDIKATAPTIMLGGGVVTVAAALAAGGGPGGASSPISLSGVIKMDGPTNFTSPVTFASGAFFRAPVTGTIATWSTACFHPNDNHP